MNGVGELKPVSEYLGKGYSTEEINNSIAIKRALDRLRPKNATGVYITSIGISFGFRTNPEKFPKNFLLLWPPRTK